MQVIPSTSRSSDHKSFSQTTTQFPSTISEPKPRNTITNVLVPTYIPWAHDTGTCIEQGDLFSFCPTTQTPVSATANTGKTRERFGKNAGEWTGGIEMSKEEIPGRKRCMYGYMLTYSRLYRKNL